MPGFGCAGRVPRICVCFMAGVIKVEFWLCVAAGRLSFHLRKNEHSAGAVDWKIIIRTKFQPHNTQHYEDFSSNVNWNLLAKLSSHHCRICLASIFLTGIFILPSHTHKEI